VRIAIGQLWQETNTFNPLPTTQADFESFGVLRGPDLLEQLADTNEPGGFIQSLRRWPEQPEIIGLVRLPAWPSGPATAETLDWLCEEMEQALKAALPVDALLLALHGAMVAENEPDVEGRLLGRLRALVGPGIPIVATLDLHANVTRRMVALSEALVLYHTAPHIDVFETGVRAAAVLRRILVDRVRPVTAWQKIPAIFPAERANTQDARSVSFGLRCRLQELERDPKILSAGLATVQPWLDIPELGSMVVVLTDGDAALARRSCAGVAQEVWDRRREYLPELVPVADAVRMALAHPEGLTVLSDSADATTSGAPGDSNWVLRDLVRHAWPRPALLTLVDPELVLEATERGIGARWTSALGGKRDKRFSQPFLLEIEVVRLFDANFVLSGHLARNLPIHMGPSAVVRHGNVHIVVTSRTGPHFAPQLFQAAGFDPFAASVVVAKSPCGFRAAYQERARQILVVRAPGCAPADFWRYDYRRIDRPLWPWDEIPEWTAKPEIGRE